MPERICELSCETSRVALKKKKKNDEGICKMKRLICFFSPRRAQENERARKGQNDAEKILFFFFPFLSRYK
jgi:hypothetical protein